MILENTPALQTTQLLLRRFEPEDAPALFELLQDQQVNRFLPWFALTTLDQAQAFLQERFLDTYQNPSGYRYAVCLKSDNRPIGYVWMSNGESRDFGYALARPFWHQGIATQAAAAVLDRVRQAGYPYVTATHDRCNPRSGAVMRRLGMRYCYSYVEQWQPKNIPVTFRLYQINFDGDHTHPYMQYWHQYPEHFIEPGL
jgi:ribosomal-protein-alanine N-acetyltransferase